MPRPQIMGRGRQGGWGWGGGTKTLTGIAISQAVEATRNVPSPEKAHNLCLHVSICCLRRGRKTAVKMGCFKVETHEEETKHEVVSKGCE